VSQNGQDVWTIADHVASIAQLNTIVQAATGPGHVSPVTLSTTGVPWATTYVITDPDNGPGYQWQWVTQALEKAGNGAANNWMNGPRTDTLTVPWPLPPGQPSYAEATHTLGQAPGFGVDWVPPSCTVTVQPVLGAHPMIRGTWTMRFSAHDWRALSPAQRAAIRAWWQRTDAQAVFRVQHGSPSWNAALALKPGANGPWGVVIASTATLASTFWFHRAVTRVEFNPAARWVLPPNWVNAGLSAPRGWNGSVALRVSSVSLPFGGQLLHQTTEWGGADWATGITQESWRWAHVAEVGCGGSPPGWEWGSGHVHGRGVVSRAVAGLWEVLAERRPPCDPS